MRKTKGVPARTRRRVPPRPRCRHCERALTTVYRQRRTGGGLGMPVVPLWECERCGVYYDRDSLEELARTRARALPPRGEDSPGGEG